MPAAWNVIWALSTEWSFRARHEGSQAEGVARPVRSELIYLLVSLDKQYTADAPGEPWETYYAREIARHFQLSGG